MKLVKDQLVGCMGRFYIRVPGKDRSRDKSRGFRIKVGFDKKLTEISKVMDYD